MKKMKMSVISRNLSNFNKLLEEEEPIMVTKWNNPMAVIIPLTKNETSNTISQEDQNDEGM